MPRRNDQDGLYQRPDSKMYWASFVDGRGKRTRRSTGTADRKEAEALLAKWKLEAHQEKHWDAPPPVAFEEVMVAFLQATAAIKRSHRDDKLHTRQWQTSLAGRDLRTLTPLDIRAHVNRRIAEGVANATINRELSVLSAAINFYNKEQLETLPNPTRGRKLREPEARIRWIAYAEADRLLAAAGEASRAPHLADFIALALHTGCRSGELLGLEWARVDLQQRLIHLEGIHTKAGKRRSVPLNNEAYRALLSRANFRATHCPDTPWVFASATGQRLQSVKKSFATACHQVGIEDFRIHDLRHTCAAWLVSAGVALPEVRDLLGHSTITMTEKYAHLSPDNVRRAVAVLDRASHDLVTAAGDGREKVT